MKLMSTLRGLGQLIGIAVAAPLSFFSIQHVAAGEDDRYRYVLAKEHANVKVCTRMNAVYNNAMAYPWKRPALLPSGTTDPNYGSDGKYSFPLVDGVSHNDRATVDMSYSRLPTSPEFDAIRWRQGQFRYEGDPSGLQPMLVAEFDIANNGRAATVFKINFMRNANWYRGRGGEDFLLVFEEGGIDISKPVELGRFFRLGVNGKRPAQLTLLPSFSYRLVRPFIYEGVTYLSAYDGSSEPLKRENSQTREHMRVLRFVGTSESATDLQNIVHAETICSFRMLVVR